MKNRTKFTIFCIAALVVFTAAVLVLTYHDKTVPDALIQHFFTAFTVELAILFGIKLKG